METIDFHPLEDADSRQAHNERLANGGGLDSPHQQRHLKNHDYDYFETDYGQEEEFWKNEHKKKKKEAKKAKKHTKKRTKRLNELYRDPGIRRESVHGLMIDAGSSGSRLHVYEWEPRILKNEAEVQLAVSGNKLSYPGTESRWTDRLSPGLGTFADIENPEELREAVAKYLDPLLNFAKTVLHSKQERFHEFPIFLRATAGLRILDTDDRARVVQVVRDLFANKTYCPFAFVPEQARVLSGEEEAIFDWTGVNFLLGDLIDESQGAGTVLQPRLTHGALDLGGASTQISFYESNEDIMANLFKLQIGQAKHWNLYAHSFLFYGINEAIHRLHSHLAAGKTVDERLVNGVYNPCLPGGLQIQVRSDMHMSKNGVETWDSSEDFSASNGYYHTVLRNDNDRGDPDMCLELAKGLLHLEKNDWCDFAHRKDCSFAGAYQPKLPFQSPGFGEFVAFSNYWHIWQFLKLPERATIAQLENATRHVCSMTRDEFVTFNNGTVEEEEELNTYCFRAAYAFQLLHNGYGFQMNDTIRSTRVINGKKVGWPLGAMLYEINTMPWKYTQNPVKISPQNDNNIFNNFSSMYFAVIAIGSVCALIHVLLRHGRRQKDKFGEFEPLVKTKYRSTADVRV